MAPGLNAKTIITALAFCIQVIAGAAYFWTYDHNTWDGAWKLRNNSGGQGKSFCPMSHQTWVGHYFVWCNTAYYAAASLFLLGILSLLLAIAELVIVFAADKAKFLDSFILRGVVYIVKGIIKLGTANDLGLAAGSMEIIIGAIMVICVILQKVGVGKAMLGEAGAESAGK
jgi:hypothetical protein